MASSKLDRIGTIFTRVTALLNKGVMKKENTPLWYDLYRAFPPMLEPTFGRKAPQKEIQQIFYEEDEIRAKLHKDLNLPPVDLKSRTASHTQIFLAIYEALKQKGLEKDKAYNQALDAYKIIFSQNKYASKEQSEEEQSTGYK